MVRVEIFGFRFETPCILRNFQIRTILAAAKLNPKYNR